jgi:hypothetical protein
MITLQKSSRDAKKYQVTLDSMAVVHFGAAGYSDYTKHRDPARKQRYIQRHERREDWTRTGMHTPGFWSRWLLWNKPTLAESMEDVQRKFRVRLRRC